MSNSNNLTIPDSLTRLGIGFTPTGLLLPEGLPVENWLQLMSTLPRINDSVKWALGDALNYGEKRYGKKYVEAMDATGIKYETLRDYAYVARKIELSLRNDNLSWTHHRAVADLTPVEQAGWLEVAQEKEMSTRALREAITAAEEEEKALEEIANKRRSLPTESLELPEPDPEPQFAPPIGKMPVAVPEPAPKPERITFQPLVPREPAKPEPTRPAPSQIGEPQPTAPRTELLWRNITRAVFNFTSGHNHHTYIFEIIEVRTDGGFAYDITNNGHSLGRRSSLSGAKQRCEEYMAETLKKAEGK